MGAAESSGMSVTAATTSLPPGSTQEDIDRAIENIRRNKEIENELRKEAIIIPEDLEDIHIESPVTGTDTGTAIGTDADTNTGTGAGTGTGTGKIELLICEKPLIHSDTDHNGKDCPASNTRYGTGKHWKRNMKKQQQKEEAERRRLDNKQASQNERTQEQRRAQVRPIIDKLTELQMNMSYPAIRELYKVLNQFIKTGEDAKIKIPFPEFSRKIKGELSNAPYIPCWVKLEVE
jgi:Ethanolamine utilization protein EutJ (predicted chaperonin)